MFDIISKIHIENKHCGRTKLCNLINKEYHNITRECVKIFLGLDLCNSCKSSKEEKQGTTTSKCIKPKLNVKDFNGRSWVAFLEQEVIDGKWFLLIFRECSTKFCHLRAISSIEPLTVALTLMEIMCGFGVPYILHIDGSTNFQERVLQELSKALPSKVILGCEEEIHQKEKDDLKLLILEKIEACEGLTWPLAIKIVQQQINTLAVDRNITPYELLFGSKMNLNNVNTCLASLPPEFVLDIFLEDDTEC